MERELKLKVSKFIFSLALLSVGLGANAESVKNQLLGKKLTIDGASCAGLSFSKNGKDAFMYDEAGFTCEPNLNLRVRWLDDKTFILFEKDRTNDISPPRAFLYQVQKANNLKVTLSEIWTGWNQYPDEKVIYDIDVMK